MSSKLIGIVGWKDSGKTALVEALVQHFTRNGLRVATIKHAHHNFDTDQPGTDSYRHRAAGANQVIVASAKRWVHLNEVEDSEPPNLSQLVEKLTPVDLIIVEGFKRESHPKIHVMRPSQSNQPLPAEVSNVVALASDDLNLGAEELNSLQLLDLNDIDAIADYIIDYLCIEAR